MTTEQLSKLTPEQKQTMIAEALGFSDVSFDWDSSGEMRYREWTGIPRGEAIRVRLPDYLNDLNACHEMENALDIFQWLEYVHRLESDIHAEASERADAFLLTITPNP